MQATRLNDVDRPMKRPVNKSAKQSFQHRMLHQKWMHICGPPCNSKQHAFLKHMFTFVLILIRNDFPFFVVYVDDNCQICI